MTNILFMNDAQYSDVTWASSLPQSLAQLQSDQQWPFLLTWFNFNPSMDK